MKKVLKNRKTKELVLLMGTYCDSYMTGHNINIKQVM